MLGVALVLVVSLARGCSWGDFSEAFPCTGDRGSLCTWKIPCDGSTSRVEVLPITVRKIDRSGETPLRSRGECRGCV